MGLVLDHHDVVTDDGYILDLWHVYKPNTDKKYCSMNGDSYPIFFQQGYVDMGGTWFFNPNSQSIGE